MGSVMSDSSDVLSVLAAHLPIQLAERYGEKMCQESRIRRPVERCENDWWSANAA